MARVSRVAQSRTATTRSSDMRPQSETHFQSKLHVPSNKIPDGMTYAWVRESTLNEPDPDNMTDRMVRGWAPVPAARHAEMVPPPLPGHEGLEASVIRRGGLILCERLQKMWNSHVRNATLRIWKFCRMWLGLVSRIRICRALTTVVLDLSASLRLRINSSGRSE